MAIDLMDTPLIELACFTRATGPQMHRGRLNRPQVGAPVKTTIDLISPQRKIMIKLLLIGFVLVVKDGSKL